jgi:hypothetical protein
MSETDLNVLIRTMSPRLHAGLFAFVSVPRDAGSIQPGIIVPVMTFQEAEGMTLIAPAEQISAAGLVAGFTARMITLEIHSSLEAVGFLAAITPRLAAAGIAVNAVSAFHHDHLFVVEARADETMTILRAMAET